MSCGKFFLSVVCTLQGLTCSALAQQPGFANGVALGTIRTNLAELSGLAASRRNPGVVWAHNDGSRDRVYAFATNGEHLATFEINENIEDLEDIIIGPGPLPHFDYIYAGDIGDNDSERANFVVYRMPEPAAYTYQATMPESDALSRLNGCALCIPTAATTPRLSSAIRERAICTLRRNNRFRVSIALGGLNCKAAW